MIQGNSLPDADPFLLWSISPTGGIIALEMYSAAAAATWSLTRYVSINGTLTTPTVLFTGASNGQPYQVFIDVGDQTKAPLDPTQLYVYVFATANGTIQSDALSPACSVTLELDQTDLLLYRALQSGIKALVLPASFNNKPSIVHAMPLGVAPTLPVISFNETLLQQAETQIGENVDGDSTLNQFQVAQQAMRHYTIFIAAASPVEREYYKHAVIAIYKALLGPILNRIGENVSHRFQATSSQVVGRENEPGFFFAEILLEFTGLYTIGVNTNYGVIENFVVDATNAGLITDTIG